VFWVHASNATRLEQSFRDIADTVKIFGRQNPKANIFKLVHDWLHEGKSGKWVLVLDNVDDARFLLDSHLDTQGKAGSPVGTALRPLRDYLPQSPSGSILITSRSKDAALKLVEQRDLISVEPMDKGNALALFKKKLGEPNDSKDIAELAAALEYMPLAIVQAAAYISDPDRQCSAQLYLKEFQKSDHKKQSLLNHEGGQLRRDPEAKNSVIITWQISFEHLRETRTSAANLLSLMSFFDRQGIPKALLRHRIEQGNSRQIQKENRNDGTDDEDSESQSSESDELEEDIVQLRKYSFISTNEAGGTFEMHRLVQLATRKWLEANGQLEVWKQQFIRNLCKEFPNGEYETWVRCQALFPHAELAAGQQPRETSSLVEWAALLYYAARYSWKKGNFDNAKKLAVKSMKARTKLFSQEHEDTLNSMEIVGLAYDLSGEWGKSAEIQLEVMETRKRVLEAEHPATLTSMANLASTYWNQGRWKEAEELEVQVMETRKRVLGAEHPDTLTSMANLASTYRNQGRWKEAEELEVQVMETSKRVLGAEHPDTLISMNNLAFTLKGRGQDAEAIELMEKCVQLQTLVIGADHPHTLSSSAALIGWHTETGD
jgi:hypothetical protein